jgi:hypothetical protein
VILVDLVVYSKSQVLLNERKLGRLQRRLWRDPARGDGINVLWVDIVGVTLLIFSKTSIKLFQASSILCRVQLQTWMVT